MPELTFDPSTEHLDFRFDWPPRELERRVRGSMEKLKNNKAKCIGHLNVPLVKIDYECSPHILVSLIGLCLRLTLPSKLEGKSADAYS